MMERTVLVRMLKERWAIYASRRKELPPVVGHGQPYITVGGRKWTPLPEGGGGSPCAFAALLATREDIAANLDNQRPLFKPLDLPKLLRV